MDVACEDSARFGAVVVTSRHQTGVFGVVQQQVLDLQLLSELTGIKNRAVVLLVGTKLLTVAVHAEGLAQELVATLDIALTCGLIGLIAQTYYVLPIRH